eukprot:g1598.t1
MDNVLNRFEQTCPECDGRDFVEDFASGDLICKRCAIVLESHSIDERSEWRTFSDSDKNGADPNRVGAPVNHLLSGGGLSTVIGKAEGDSSQVYSLGRLNARTNQTDRVLMNAFSEITAMCSKHALSDAIKDRACEIYKDYKDLRSLKGRKAVAFYAACVYFACKCEHYPRTFKEINAAAPEASKKEIARCFRLILNEMQDNKGVGLEVGTTHPSDYLKRFGSHVGFSHEEIRACNQVANAAMPKHGRENSETKPWEGRSPISIAAAIMLLIAKNSKNPETLQKIDVKAIHRVTQVSEATTMTVYKELRADAHELLPVWFVHGKKKNKKTDGAESSSAAATTRQQ